MANSKVRVSRWKSAIAFASLAFAIAALFSTPAEARLHGHHRYGFYHHSYHRHVFRHHTYRHAHFRRGHRYFARARRSLAGGVTGGNPGFAAIVVDGNSGRTLFARNEHELRHPASVTKVMTLYLLFEQLENGKLRLDSPLMISAHAAAQAPSKLGLEPGATIDVENAIKAVVTKSANDVAAAIAENIGGDEDSFAEMMTRKAHALGMSHTHYANASGLPNDAQITTAQDIAVLGRAIQDRFPRYYRYFSTHSFAYRGAVHRNHNHLLGRIEGVDGIKTGYTRASGFNLLTSVRRGKRHLIAVVMGGRTAATRDNIMAGLIAGNIANAATTPTAGSIATEGASEPAAALAAVAAGAEAQKEEAQEPAPHEAAPHDPARAYAPLADAGLVPPAPIPVSERPEKARPAFVPGGQKRAERKGRVFADGGRISAADGSTSRAGDRATRAPTATTPSAMRRPNGGDADRTLVAKASKSDTEADSGRPAHAGWMIQIGASEDVGKANALLSRARSQAHGVPATAKAFTEKVQKGKETLYRARFAGLEEKSAESACRTLKRSGFSCFATRN